MNPLLKQSVGRTRPQLFPPEAVVNGLAFPSGHAQSTMAMLAVLGVLLWPTRWRWYTIALGAPVVAAVGLSRVYLGVHFPSDVLAGWAVALMWVASLELAGLRHTGRRLERPPAGARDG